MTLVPAAGLQALPIAIFAVVLAGTLGITYWASKRARSTAEFYAAGRGITGFQNGLAISGDYLSAASFLGIAGLIYLYGFDGFLYSIGFLVAWLVALLLVAELLRNTGKFTIGDVLAFRMRQRPVRAAAAVSTLMVSLFYLLAQMAGAGGLVALLLQIPADDKIGQGVVIAVVGVLMIVYVLVGGMKGTTWVQIIKAVLLVVGAGIMTIWVLAKYAFNLSSLLGAAVDKIRSKKETTAMVDPETAWQLSRTPGYISYSRVPGPVLM
jgi:cation/acetate symporter